MFLLIFILKASIHPILPCSLFIKDGRNFSSPQPQLQPPDNRTIQNFVETYVHSYIGGYAVARRKDPDTAAILKTIMLRGQTIIYLLPSWAFHKAIWKQWEFKMAAVPLKRPFACNNCWTSWKIDCGITFDLLIVSALFLRWAQSFLIRTTTAGQPYYPGSCRSICRPVCGCVYCGCSLTVFFYFDVQSSWLALLLLVFFCLRWPQYHLPASGTVTW